MPKKSTPLVGHHKLANGYTVSIIELGYGREDGLLEAWCWDAYGDTAEDVTGWLTPEEAQAYIDRIALRDA